MATISNLPKDVKGFIMANLTNYLSEICKKLGIVTNRSLSKPSRHSLHGRKLIFERYEDRRMLAVLTVNTTADPATFDLQDNIVSLREVSSQSLAAAREMD